MKSLGQIAYETERTGPLPWDALKSATRAVWERKADSVRHEVVRRVAAAHAAERARTSETVKCRCGARHMRGESHICNDDPKLIARLTGK